ncbi:DegV family protein with EDD domain [Neisseria perflava]|uniref:DegV family protein n=1 Tax=Neisseria perflava TaxID=33053 RepID=UPI0020A20622|nr:DegV family protein [Neisseria perflava]MCP1772924.1 DegV family protein with EDD domain [Neisseria perflava]
MSGSYSLYRCAVLSTSSSSLSGILDRDSPVQILPLGVTMGDHTAADGFEVDNPAYCGWRQAHLGDAVGTTPPPLEYLRSTFLYLVNQGYHQAIVTTLSHQLSDTAQTVRMLAEEIPQLAVHVVDTGSCCMPEGFFTLEAVRLLGEGKSPEETVDYLERLKPRCHIVFGLSSLKALNRGGTLARLGASFSDWLGLRNVLDFSSDRLAHIQTAGNDEDMFAGILAHMQKLMAGKNPDDFVLAGIYTGSDDLYHQFANYVHRQTGWRLGDGVPVSAAVAVHVGISGVGVGLVEKLKA